jgi:hypothetical protein
MQGKSGKDGFVVISVHIRLPADAVPAKRKKTEAAALKFLQGIKANYATLALDEPYEVWSKKLKEAGTPVVYLFNRRNETVGKYTDTEETEAGLKKWLPKLLESK